MASASDFQKGPVMLCFRTVSQIIKTEMEDHMRVVNMHYSLANVVGNLYQPDISKGCLLLFINMCLKRDEGWFATNQSQTILTSVGSS